MNRSLLLIMCCLCSATSAVRADDSAQVSDAAVRDAVARSLPYLEHEGTAWMDTRGCMSCHHVPFLLWSHRAAQAKGLAVDAAKLAEWEAWSRKDSLSHRNAFRLQKYDLGLVDASKLPDAIRQKLQPLIEQPFKTEAEFVAKLTPLLSADELKLYQPIVQKTAERTPFALDRTGGGLDVIAQLLLGSRGAPGVLNQPEFRDGLVDVISQTQLPDGSWTPGNQLATLRRWPLVTANQCTTMWAALALSAYDAPGAKRSAAIEKAIAYERQQPPHPDNREWLATRLLFEHRFGSAEDVAKLRQQLLEARHTDGSWGWEKGIPGDAFTTGLALYVLVQVGAGDDAAVLRDARQWLLKSQQPDGSWPTPAKNLSKSTDPERLKVRDEIYHYWGTAWAALGLLETLGKSGT